MGLAPTASKLTDEAQATHHPPQLAHRRWSPRGYSPCRRTPRRGSPQSQLTERKTHFILTNGNEVVATMAGPNAAAYATILSAAIVKGAI